MEALTLQFTPFSPLTKFNFIIGILDYLLGFIGNGTLFFLWWKHRNEDTDKYSIIIIAADFLGIVNFITESLSLSLGGYQNNALGPGAHYCIAVGIGSFVTSLTNLLCITLYAFHRYRIIFHKDPLPLSQCFAITGCYCLLCLVVAISAFFLGAPFKYRPAGTYCLFDWRDKSAATMIPIVFGCIAIAGCLSGLLFMYYKILVSLRKVSRSFNIEGIPEALVRDSNDVTLSVETVIGVKGLEREMSVMERRLFQRVIIIVFVCFFCYTPYFFSCAYEVLSDNEVSPSFDSVAADLIVANGLFGFLVLITTNSSYRRIFWGLFGIHLDD